MHSKNFFYICFWEVFFSFVWFFLKANLFFLLLNNFLLIDKSFEKHSKLKSVTKICAIFINEFKMGKWTFFLSRAHLRRQMLINLEAFIKSRLEIFSNECKPFRKIYKRYRQVSKIYAYCRIVHVFEKPLQCFIMCKNW